MLNFNLDVSVGTETKHYTPSAFAKGLPFYVESFSHYIAYSGYYTERWDVNSYYLTYTLSGKGLLKYRDKEYTVVPGTAFFIDCREYQYYQTVSEEPWEFYYVHFNGMNVKTYFEYIFKNGFNLIVLKDKTVIEGFFKLLFNQEMDFSQNYELIISQEITNVLTHLAMIEDKKTKSFDTVIQYIMKNYDKKISIDHLAHISNFSKYHFIRSFRQQYSDTPYEFITRYRINMAKQMLEDTEESVESVAIKVGFNDVNTFIRAFSKLMGSTPHQYRKSR